MRTQKITRTIYVADDGKEFLTASECEKHEKFVKEVLENIRYFCVRCMPDLTETGLYQHKIYVAVFAKRYAFYQDIVMEWAIRKFKRYLGESVMGYGFQPHFTINPVDTVEYSECPPTKWGGSEFKSERVFLSPEPMEGFPENVNYMKEWGFK